MRKVKSMAAMTIAAVLTASMSMTAFAAEGFDAAYYAAQNPDVVAVVGQDAAALELHYETFGKAEGRAANAQGGAVATAASDVVAFDAAYYAAMNPDVVAIYGTDMLSLYTHYITTGIYEGRSGSATFNVAAYKAANPDLAAAFGDDLAAYVMHFDTVGKAEGRSVGTAAVSASTGSSAAEENPYARFAGGGSSSSSSSDDDDDDSSSESSSSEAACSHEYAVIEGSETDPTCTTYGAATLECNKCGDSYVDEYYFDSIDHDTDGEDGACSMCGYKEEEPEEHEHVFEYESEEDGTHTVSCTADGCEGGFEESEECDEAGAEGACSKCGYKAE